LKDNALERARGLFRAIAAEAGLTEADVSVLAKPLTPEEAIGTPGRRDFPILVGRERVVEARVGEGRGHAFTDTAREFVGRLSEVIERPLDDNGGRAVYVAALNATLVHLGRIQGAVHCRDDDPELCGAEIAESVGRRVGEQGVVGLIGFNPAIADHLVGRFGSQRVRITDLNPSNIGERKFGVEVWDGGTRTDDLIDAADLVLFTGSTLVNGSFDAIDERVRSRNKIGLVYGVTAAGVAELLGYERTCPYGR
jgi:hypothetical protein